MKKAVKVTIWSILALFLLIAAGLILLVNLVNPNNYKSHITEAVQKATGRTLTIKGNISWSLFPWLGLDLQDITLGNPPGFNQQSDFAAVKDAGVSVQLLPLLVGKIEAGRISLVDPMLHLIVLKNGNTNFDFSQSNEDVQPAAKPSAASSSSKISDFTIADLNINNAHIIWDNERDKQYIEVTRCDFSGKDMGLNRLFPLTLNLEAKSKDPNLASHVMLKGKILISPQKQHYKVSSLDFSIETTGDVDLKAAKGIADIDLQVDKTGQGSNAFLKQLRGEGTVHINDVFFNKIHLSDLILTLHAKSGQIALDPMKANLYRGAYNGSVNIDAAGAQPLFKIVESIHNVEVGDLLKDTTGKDSVSGKFQLQMNVNTMGTAKTAFLRNMQGKGHFQLDNGVLHGISINQQLQSVNQFLAQGLSRKPVKTEPLGEQVVFTQLNGSFQITNGVVRNDDFVLRSKEFNSTGKGTVDLLPQTLQYRLLVGPGDSGSDALFGEFTKVLGDAQIPILIGGTLSHPSVSPDWDVIQKKLIQDNGKKLIVNTTQQLKQFIKF